jgi:hypothetical protein
MSQPFFKNIFAKVGQCFRNGVAPIFAKMRFRPKGGNAFCLPRRKLLQKYYKYEIEQAIGNHFLLLYKKITHLT